MSRLRAFGATLVSTALFAATLAFVLAPIASSAAAVEPAPQSILNFDGNTGWINSKPLTPQDLRGKVVLIDFWEYTCINCLRTLPYLREWEKRYASQGLVIIGVHTPEFEFSGDARNIAAAVKHLDVTWPVVMDTRDAIWNRYKNDIWPREILYDQNGNLVESVEGEGSYQATETKIQQLLKASNPSATFPPVMALLPQDSYLKPGAVCYPQTQETYVGGERGKIANAPIGLAASRYDVNYVDNNPLHVDGDIYLSGYWHSSQQAMVSRDNNGHLALKYHALQVVAVMRLENTGPVRVDVTQDGEPVAKTDAGADIKYDAQGHSYVTVDAGRAYELIMNQKWGTHELELIPRGPGVGIYSFAFESCEAASS